MDRGLSEAPKTARWLAWVVACLLLAGVVSAGVLVADGDRPGSAAVVTAAGDRSTIDVTSTVTVPLPPSSTLPTTVPTTTTRPRAAMDVLNALGTTTTTTRPRATTTTRPPAATTTVPTPTTTPTTSTTAPGQFTATLVNEHPRAVAGILNGRSFSLQPGQSLREDLPVASRRDLVQVWLADNEKCGVSDSGVIFKAGASYRVAIVPGETPCKDVVGPLLRIGPG